VNLEGATCLVTGASTGIGRATALALASAGACVRAGSRTPDRLAGLHPAIVPVALDVCDAGSCAAAVGDGVDVLVNNAGYGLEGAVEEVGDDELRRQFEVNVFAVWRLCRLALGPLRARGGGAIVNVSSFGGEVPFPNIGAYRASKFAVEGLTWTLQLEVGRFGIRVASVQPGLTDSDFSANMVRADGLDDAGPYAELRRSAAEVYPRMSPVAIAPETVATAIVDWLAADRRPLHVRVGEDAERMVAVGRAGTAAYERYLADVLGFDWVSSSM
jgi:NAD(P)-dependent dehydrogenase (short-subunit alcohol dehydrogenase family)